jgi:hypothetical protein
MRSITRGVIGVVLIGSIRGCGWGWNFHGDAWRWWNMSWRLVLWDLVLEDAHRIIRLCGGSDLYIEKEASLVGLSS